ncbi:helix-turn-helix transcriptional regulator [Pseudomonas oryzihabitans]|uniref:helix-turn-helix transcriptional regulator n=1 Tax=Pseudomonas oryzihabitans TaxID=47885 RepID=UPI0028950C23|nr:helix-turn-helix transcriptional regulator [Pseudomonas oryzihabitans]MDT3718465.1 helix-turn-helix transcriptional regulator [Pseudomonas oryzihabitans]
MSTLKKVREKSGITQLALAKKVGLTQGAIAHYETGRRTPGLSMSRRIVAGLNALGAKCNLSDVFPEPGHEDQAPAA